MKGDEIEYTVNRDPLVTDSAVEDINCGSILHITHRGTLTNNEMLSKDDRKL